MSSSVLNIDFSDEFVFKTSRSSGPGGQHINKTETRVTLRFNVLESKYLDSEQKNRIIQKLSGYVNAEGELIINAEDSRSQIRNKELCVQKFYDFIEYALKKPKKRIPTKPSRAAIRKRIENKRKNAEKKNRRKNPGLE